MFEAPLHPIHPRLYADRPRRSTARNSGQQDDVRSLGSRSHWAILNLRRENLLSNPNAGVTRDHVYGLSRLRSE